MAPPVRLELTTSKLTASCSTIELQGIITQFYYLTLVFVKSTTFSHRLHCPMLYLTY